MNNPIPREWQSYVTQTNLGLEVIPAMLYDTEDYTTAVTTELTFFTSIQGKKKARTNMKSAGQLPNPESQLIQNIRVFFWSNPQSDDSGAGDSTDVPSQFMDVVQLTTKGVLELLIGEKKYGPWPLWTLPAHNFVKGAFASGSDLLADYGQVDGYLYSLFPNLMIAPLQPFSVTLSWPDGPLTLSQENEVLPIEVLFDGQRARAIQ